MITHNVIFTKINFRWLKCYRISNLGPGIDGLFQIDVDGVTDTILTLIPGPKVESPLPDPLVTIERVGYVKADTGDVVTRADHSGLVVAATQSGSPLLYELKETEKDLDGNVKQKNRWNDNVLGGYKRKSQDPTGIALNGVFSTVLADNETAAGVDGFYLNAGQNLTVEADDVTSTVNVGLAWVYAGETGVAANVAFNRIERDTRAEIGNADTSGEVFVSAPAGNIVVDARNDGWIVSASASGVLQRVPKDNEEPATGDPAKGYPPSLTKTQQKNLEAKEKEREKEEEERKKKWLQKNMPEIAAAGNLSINEITDTTVANVSFTTIFEATDVTVHAHNGTWIAAASGSGAVSMSTYNATSADNDKVKEQRNTPVVSGAATISVTVNTLGGNTSASIDESTVSVSGDVDVSAETAQTIVSIAAAGSVSVAKNSKGFGIAGSAAVSRIDSETQAWIAASTVTTTGGKVLVAADDKNVIVTVAGSLSATSAYAPKETKDEDKRTQVGVAASAAVAYSSVENTVRAYITGSTINAPQGPIDVLATSGETVITLAAGVSGGGARDGKEGFALAAGGSVAINSVDTIVEAYLTDNDEGAPSVSAVNGELVTVRAEDKTSIITFAGGLGISVATADDWAVSAALGAAVAMNVVDTTVASYISNSNVTGQGTATAAGVTVDATADTTIFAMTLGGFGAGAKSANEGAFALSGGAAESINLIGSSVHAYIDDGSDVSADVGGVTLNAEDTSSTIANAAVASVGVAIGKKWAAAGAVAGVFSVNVMDKEVKSYISSSTATAAREVDLDATSSGKIWALTIGAAGAGGKAEDQFGGALTVAGAGSINKIDATVETFITDGSTVNSGASQEVSLLADDSSSIIANAGVLSIAVGIGSKGAALSLGGAVAVDFITGDIRSHITDSTVNASGGVELTAESNASIWGMTLGGVGAGGKGTGGLGLALSGAGAGSVNSISRTIETYITKTDTSETSSVTTGNNQGIVLNAEDNSDIIANAGVLGVAVGYGGSTGIGGSMGASVNVNLVDNAIRSYISGTTVVSAAEVDLDATSDASIWALAVAGSVGVGVGKDSTGIGVAISGATCVNIVGNAVSTSVDGSHITSTNDGAITLDAKDTTLIMADAGGVSIAVGYGQKAGLGVALGGSVAVNVVDNDVRTSISDSTIGTVTEPVGAVTLTAVRNADIWALTIAGSVGLGYGQNSFGAAVSGAVAGSVNVIGGAVEAFIVDGSTVTSNGSLAISATDTSRIIANSIGGSIAVGVGKTGVGVSIGGAFAFNTIDNDVRAYIDDSTIDISGPLSVTATSDATIWALTVGVSISAGVGLSGGPAAAAVSIGVSLAHNTIDNEILAAVKDAPSVLTDGGDVTLSATDNAEITANAVAASIAAAFTQGKAGVAVSGGAAESTNIILNTTNACIDGSIVGTPNEKVGHVDLDAKSTSTIDAVIAAAALGVSYGGQAGVGVSIGISVARNFIGWAPTVVKADYTTRSRPKTLTAGKTVKVKKGGARGGEVYEYVGGNLADDDGIDRSSMN